MFNLKVLLSILGVSFAIICASTPNLEAGHHHRHHHCRGRSNLSINIGPTFPSPTYVVTSPAYVPVYAPQPVVAAYPVYQPVYVVPQPRLFSGFSFNWFFR